MQMHTLSVAVCLLYSLLSVFVLAADATPDMNCGQWHNISNGYDGQKQVSICQESLSRDEGFRVCQDKGASLLSISDNTYKVKLWEFFKTTLQPSFRYWVGLYLDNSGREWVWPDHRNYNPDIVACCLYRRWHDGEPNNRDGNESCVDVSSADDDFRLNDNNCAWQFSFMCERTVPEDCVPGTYGKGNGTGCPNQCGNCEGGSCRATDGVCTGGCKHGWQPTLCQQACHSGWFGQDCQSRCGNCSDSTCNHVNGHCNGVCKAGWKGSRCDEQCADGVYGDNCSSSCQKTCANSSCHHVTGHCALGCVEGWLGDFCTTQIASALDVFQDFNTELGVGLGTLLLVLLLMLTGLCYWRRLQKRSARETVEAHELRAHDMNERVDEEAGSAVQPARPNPDANPMKEKEEENWYEKIEEAEDRPRMAAAPGIQTNQYEGLDSTTRWASPSTPYEPLQGASAVVSPRVYENCPKVTATNPAMLYCNTNSSYQNVDG